MSNSMTYKGYAAWIECNVDDRESTAGSIHRSANISILLLRGIEPFRELQRRQVMFNKWH